MLDTVVDWASSLSIGEQQRVAWARMLLAKPKLALLDESTSALDAETEEFLYEQLEDSGVTYVSVGHRPSLKPFHKQKLSIFGAFSGACLLYTSPSPRDRQKSRMPSSA